MHDKFKVIAGLAAFFVLVTMPFWMGTLRSAPTPTPDLSAKGSQCVEPVEYMRANHMKLLDNWRNSVVRDGDRVYVNSAGKEFQKSLTNTCLNCHAQKEQFCDQCHKSVAVEPYCFSCHLTPGQKLASVATNPALMAMTPLQSLSPETHSQTLAALAPLNPQLSQDARR